MCYALKEAWEVSWSGVGRLTQSRPRQHDEGALDVLLHPNFIHTAEWRGTFHCTTRPSSSGHGSHGRPQNIPKDLDETTKKGGSSPTLNIYTSPRVQTTRQRRSGARTDRLSVQPQQNDTSSIHLKHSSQATHHDCVHTAMRG